MLLVLIISAGCATRGNAPVIDRTFPAGRPATPPSAPVAVPSSATTTGPAASVGGVRATEASPETYTVKRGDTLYAIALDHGLDYRELAQWNKLDNPNVIRAGQELRLTEPGTTPVAAGVQVRPAAPGAAVESRPLGSAPALARSTETVKSEPRAVKLPYSEENLALLSREPKPAAVPVAAPTSPPAPVIQAAELKPSAETKPAAPAVKPAPPAPPVQQVARPPANSEDDDSVEWGWPTAGRISAGFSESPANTNKGIDIGGKSGQSVVASATGTVLYVGTGIRGYGKLIVVRHNKAYSTVYAHNDNILVKEGQRVVKGQKLAEMGNSDTDQVKLHFEIRRLGKPVDPAKFLPER